MIWKYLYLIHCFKSIYKFFCLLQIILICRNSRNKYMSDPHMLALIGQILCNSRIF